MSLSQNQSRYKLIICVGIGVIIIIIITLLIGAFTSKNKDDQTILPSPSPIDLERFIPPIDKREETPQAVLNIKDQILQNATDDNGDKILIQSKGYRIIYVPTLDTFLVLISKDPAETYRSEAQNYFLANGLSLTDICNLPVRFVINPEQKSTNPNFNYFPDNCS